MKNYYKILLKCPLFQGIEENELDSMFCCLKAGKINVAKDEAVFLEGDEANFVGVVLSGKVQVVREDYYGYRSVMAVINPGELFAETFSCAGAQSIPVSAFAVSKSEILMLDSTHLFSSCSNSCDFHNKLQRNLLQVMAEKNLALSRKIRYMSKKTTSEKLMAYLLDQAKQYDSNEFVIPFNRQALADYLGVERSAMSAEISKLKQSGRIDTKGSWFRIN